MYVYFKKGLLDSLIAEGGVKSRDLSWVIYIGVVIEIRTARSDRNAAKFYGYPYFNFHLEEIFCTHTLRKCEHANASL